MTAHSATLERRAYGFHDQVVEVRADDPAVLGAIHTRFLGFRQTEPPPATIRLEFLTRPDIAAQPVTRDDRPVYETRHGSLHYDSGSDRLHGTFGGVTLDCRASAGTASFCSTGFTDRDLYLATHPLATVSLMELMERRDRFSLRLRGRGVGRG